MTIKTATGYWLTEQHIRFAYGESYQTEIDEGRAIVGVPLVTGDAVAVLDKKTGRYSIEIPAAKATHIVIRVKFVNERYNFNTRFNGTFEAAHKYYVGVRFNLGSVTDDMQVCTSIELLGTAE